MTQATLDKQPTDRLHSFSADTQQPPVMDRYAGQNGKEVVISYHHLPAVKHSHYHWKTALSFFSEAVGGGSQVIATLLHLRGAKEKRLIRAARYLALTAVITSPALLISELHMARRWYNMLRIFRPTSGMSVGNLSLTSFSVFSTLTAAGQLLEDRGYRRGSHPMTLLRYPAAMAGAMVCLYSGSELEQTCSPLWAQSHPLLPALFAATGLSVGASALSLTALSLHEPPTTHERLRTISLVAQGVQLFFALKARSAWQERSGTAAFDHSRASRRFTAGALGMGMILPITLRLLRSSTGPGRKIEMVAAGATLAGAYLVYNTVIEAGNVSTEKPEDYLESSRQKHSNEVSARKPTGNRWKKFSYGLMAASACAVFLWKRRNNG